MNFFDALTEAHRWAQSTGYTSTDTGVLLDKAGKPVSLVYVLAHYISRQEKENYAKHIVRQP